MKIEQIHSFALSIFCSLMLGTAVLPSGNPFILAGMGSIGASVQTMAADKLFETPHKVVALVDIMGNQPLTPIVNYGLTHGTEKELDPRLILMLGWTQQVPPLTAKWRVIKDNDGIHFLHVVTQRGKIEIVLIIKTETDMAAFITTPAANPDELVAIHGNKDRGRHDKPRNVSLDMFKKETKFWLDQAALLASAKG